MAEGGLTEGEEGEREIGGRGGGQWGMFACGLETAKVDADMARSRGGTRNLDEAGGMGAQGREEAGGVGEGVAAPGGGMIIT